MISVTSENLKKINNILEGEATAVKAVMAADPKAAHTVVRVKGERVVSFSVPSDEALRKITQAFPFDVWKTFNEGGVIMVSAPEGQLAYRLLVQN